MRRTPLFVWLCLLAAALALTPVAATGIRESESPIITNTDALIAAGTRIADIGLHAAGFEAYDSGDLTIVRVTRPWPTATADDTLTYVLYPRGGQAPQVAGADLVVGVPIASMVSMSTTFLAQLEKLDALDVLTGVDSRAWAYSPAVHAMSIEEVGSGPGADVERLIALDPDMIMVNSYGGGFDAQPVLEAAGLPAVVSGDWVEGTPLGRAEWLVFTALFLDRRAEAVAMMSEIADAYESLARSARAAEPKPSILINAPFQGSWAIAGGASYAATFIRDAGGDYIWSDDASTGALFLDIESVYQKASDADVWINTSAWQSLAEGEADDERFTRFAAFESGRLYNNNRRLGAGGGNDYFESGAVNPHIVLRDLVWIFHRDLVPGHEPFYYQQLR